MNNRDLHELILQEYEQDRLNAVITAEEHLSEVYEKLPSVKKIDERLFEIGSEAAMQIAGGADVNEVREYVKSETAELKAQRETLLVSAGYSKNYTEVQYKCSVCKDTGYTGSDKCDCFSRRLVEKNYATSPLNNLLDKQTFETFDLSLYSDRIDEESGISNREMMRGVYNTCLDFTIEFDNSDENLLFYGDIGLGKTFLSSAITKEMIDRGKSVVYESAVSLFSMYTNYIFGRIPADQVKDKIDILYTCDLLVIDDLGTEAATAQTTSFFFEILNQRLLSGKKMIISTNLSLEGIAQKYSPRVRSRIIERFTLLKFSGSDIRQKKLFE